MANTSNTASTDEAQVQIAEQREFICAARVYLCSVDGDEPKGNDVLEFGP